MCTWNESIIQAENISGFLLTKFQSNKNQHKFVKHPKMSIQNMQFEECREVLDAQNSAN